jgi:hypothetical protein
MDGLTCSGLHMPSAPCRPSGFLSVFTDYRLATEKQSIILSFLEISPGLGD